MLRAENLTKIYETKGGYEVLALEDVCLTFGETGLVFLLGASGCGKSTLLNLLGGLDRPTEGRVLLDGEDIFPDAKSDPVDYRNMKVGFVFQEYALVEKLSVGRNVGLALELQGKKAPRERVDGALRAVGLTLPGGETLYDRRPGELSGGQKQRVAVARALVKRPRIILADEPTGALDAATGRELYGLLKKLSEDTLVIAVTHDQESAEAFGDRIILLEDGQVVSDSAPETEAPETARQAETSEPGKKAKAGKKLRAAKKGRQGRKGAEGSAVSGKARKRYAGGNLHIWHAAKLGFTTFSDRRWRLAVSIFLSFLIFVVFAFALNVCFVSEFEAEIRTVYESGATTAGVYRPDGGVSAFGSSVKSRTGKAMMRFERESVLYSDYSDYGSYETGGRYSEYLVETASYVLAVPSGVDAEDLALSPDERFEVPSLCRMPENSGEIAITDFYADLFIRYGLWQTEGEGAEEVLLSVSSPDDLIGVSIGGRTVVGVYSTPYDLAEYREYDVIGYYEDVYIEVTLAGIGTSMISYSFTALDEAEEESADFSYDLALFFLSGSLRRDTQLMEELADIDDEVQLRTAYSGFSSNAEFIMEYAAWGVAGSAILSVFSMLLLSNFLAVNIGMHTREFGILRALGARKRDVMKIALSEGLAVAALEFVLALLGVTAVNAIVNYVLMLSIFSLGWLATLLFFALSFGSATVASLLSMRKVIKMQPIEVIKGT